MAEFQTSFIPKKPMTEEKIKEREPVSPVRFLVLLFFILMLVLGGGLYAYKIFLAKRLIAIDAQLTRSEKSFDEGLISDIQGLYKRITASKEVLSNHVVVSPLFKTLEKNTLRSVRFNQFDYNFKRDTGKIEAKMSGQASSYTALALQASLLGKEKGFINQVFSNLDVDQKGRVTFNLNFSIDPSFIAYEDNLPSVEETTVSDSNNLETNDIFNQPIN